MKEEQPKRNVADLLSFIQESLISSLDQFVGQSNDQSTRDDVTFVIEMFMRDLQHRNEINNFKAICNNSPFSIKDNMLICDVFIQPTLAWSELYNIQAVVVGSTLTLDSTILTKQDYETRYDYAMAILGKK